MTQRMKMLLVLARPLFPVNTGGQIRSMNIFSRLARRMEIHCVSLADERKERDAAAQMRELFASYTPVYWRETPKFTPRFYLEFLASRFSPLPYFLVKYCRPELRRAAEQVLREKQIDLVLCDFLHVGAALLDLPAPRRVVFQHNVEYVIRKRHWQTETNPLLKWMLRAEWQKARAVEEKVCRSFDRVITVSEEDSRQMAAEFGIDRVSALPTGVDIEFFRPQPAQQKPGGLVFVGSMDWHPNEDGIVWFVRDVYPRIRQAAPQASLTVVGRNPSARLKELAAADSSVEITGTVEDVRPYLARAEVAVVPLRIGGGTRIKIFEAMAMERPVVSTRVGAEGLPVEHGREILLEDDAEGFAQAVAGLLRDSAHRQAIARAAREKVVREHTWETVTARMEEILLGVAQAGLRASRAASSLGVEKTPAILAE